MTLTTGNAYHVIAPGAFAPKVEISPQAEWAVLPGPNSRCVFDSWAVGVPTPTVQWEVSSDDGENWAPVPLATDSCFVIEEVTTEVGNSYRAVWTNDEGSATSGTSSVVMGGPAE